MADPQAVAVQIGDFDLTRPVLSFDGGSKFERDGVDVTNPHVDERSRPSITGMLRKVHPGVSALDTHVEGQSGLEAMIELALEAKSLVPAQRNLRISNAEDGDDLLGHVAECTAQKSVAQSSELSAQWLIDGPWSL